MQADGFIVIREEKTEWKIIGNAMVDKRLVRSVAPCIRIIRLLSKPPSLRLKLIFGTEYGVHT